MVRKDHSRDNDKLPLPRPTGVAWHRSSRLHQTQTIRLALNFQRQLENAVQDVVRLAGPTPPVDGTGAEMQQLSNELTDSSSGLHDFFSDFASTALHNERRSDGSCPARRVFDLPEVLEQILGYLGTFELLRAMEVDRTMYQAIESSPLLQERLRLRPSLSGYWENPFLASSNRLRERGLDRGRPLPSSGFPGFACRIYTTAEGTGFAGVTAKFPHEIPRIGKRCRAMLVCQPPVYTMGVYPTCCMYNPYGFAPRDGERPEPARKDFAGGRLIQEVADPPFDVVTSDRGVTVGDLCDMAVKTRKLHEKCPWAPPAAHTDEGDVFVNASFGGAVKLQADDPAVKLNDVAPVLPRDYVDPFSSTRPFGILDRYVAAKGRGKQAPWTYSEVLI
ncbi:hypothetical protein M409DRAFT_17143 [Zasmidium cellare ATCC 36951]|uniref:F-box domain-containing protein n=1 Tax=Zasmidium cellare ATCC 36951 TaxID=1080233 RepID=A0A6A6D449_ZASCE|nr:uncharacterized protein M409DRAFT_17143 [Zasmidium cellare ATCC 36951]KAF2173198.1 hypothetical protein M409DRAFT_17143 [Zasmidium cellare ATCC 36951]